MTVVYNLCYVLKCGKLLRNNLELSKHAKMAHDDERPFSCTVCDKRYKKRRKNSLLKRRVSFGVQTSARRALNTPINFFEIN